MKRSFASVTEVTAAAESVWNEAADGLIEIGSALDAAKEQAAGLNDVAVTEALAAAGAELGRLREVLNADPLALWQHGRIDTGRLERLRTQAAAAVARAGELARVRADARRRIAAARAAIAAVAAARQDAVTARERAAAKNRRSAAAPRGDWGPGRAGGHPGHPPGHGTVDPAGGRA